MNIGYLVPEFPSQTHVFFWREIQALRGMGESVWLLSTRRTSTEGCRHAFTQKARWETRYLFPPALGNILRWSLSNRRGFQNAGRYLADLRPTGFKDWTRRYALLSSAIDLAQWAKRLQIDHVHCHSCADAAHVVALSRAVGGPSYSLTLHGDLEVYGTDHRIKMRGAAFVHAVGNHLKTQICKTCDIAASRVFVTCMGLDAGALGGLGMNRSYVSGQIHLTTVARLSAQKGHIHALRAVKRSLQAGLDVRYTVAGEGPHRSIIESHIRDLDIGPHVTLTGTLSESEVFRLLSETDAFLLPSVGLGEAWPVSVMEAMAAGLPVIASSIGATPQMINPDQDGILVPQGDEDKIYQNIRRLAQDIPFRRRMGEAARTTARHRFDVSTTAAFLRDCIKECQASLRPRSTCDDAGGSQDTATRLAS